LILDKIIKGGNMTVKTEEIKQTSNQENPAEPEKQTALVLAEEPKKKSGKKTGRKKVDNDGYGEFPDLAKLMNTSEESLKREFFLFQVKKLMSKLGRVIVRYNETEKELERIFVNSSELGVGEVVVSPVYLSTTARLIRKNGLTDLFVRSLIDFPFGESSLKSKIADIRDSLGAGVDGITVVLPNVLCEKENVKELKKQVKKFGRSFKKGVSVALNATDLSDDALCHAVKVIEKSRIEKLTLLFGETAQPELVKRLTAINLVKGDLNISALANVDSAEGMTELFRLGVDSILTPFADRIGEELIKRFKIEGVNLR
jgi:deoxyribose-phosphate aldolase